MVSKELKELKKLKGAIFGGALATQAVGVLKSPTDVGALTSNIGGFIGIGVAGATADVGFKLATGKRKRIKKKKRR